MTYLPNIPIANDSPKNQAPLIQQDFSSFASVFSTNIGGNTYNHTAVNTTNQGDHETIILQNQTGDPPVKGNFSSLYSRNATSILGTQPQLFLRIPKFLPNRFVNKNVDSIPMQLTYNQVNLEGPIYQSFLPGGYLLFWGSTTITSPAISTQITLPLSTTKILIAIANPNTPRTTGRMDARMVSTNIDSNTKFTIYTPSFTGVVPFTFIVVATV